MREVGPDLARTLARAPAASMVPRLARDPRLDVLRGAALVTIFVNHVPGNAYEALTTRNFGFSDAAEGFVLMAGVAAGLAYGPGFRGPGPCWAGLGRVWRRAWTLYLVHLLVTAAAFGLAAGLALWAENPALLRMNQLDALFLHPLATLAALPLLLHQLSYANILPLYFVLLLAAPALLWTAWRAPWALLAGSVAVWFVAGELRLNLPSWPVPGGWQFNPLSWQVLFVVGLLVGVRLRDGRRLVPVRRWLVAAAAGVLVVSLVWVTAPGVWGPMNHALWRLEQAGAPSMLTTFDKVFESGPRLVHALALAYLLSALPIVRRLCAAPAAAPLALLGRQALPVFALGSVLAFLLQGIKAETGQDLALDTLMLGTGLALQLALAYARDRWPG